MTGPLMENKAFCSLIYLLHIGK